MGRKSKKKKRNSLLKRILLAPKYFVKKYKISLLVCLAISILVFFIYIRKENIFDDLKVKIKENIEEISDSEIIPPTGYAKEENEYLLALKLKHSGYGREVKLNDAQKAVEDACNYIANIEGVDFWRTQNAQDLLVATAVVESDLRARYSQYGGNAVGIFQIEYITFKDIWHRSLPKTNPKLYKAMQKDFGLIDFEMLQNNDMLAAIFARLVYARAKDRIPYRHDTHAQATYYKKHYNTHLGKAHTDTFIKKKSNMHKLK